MYQYVLYRRGMAARTTSNFLGVRGIYILHYGVDGFTHKCKQWLVVLYIVFVSLHE